MAGFLLFLFWLLCLAMLFHVWWRKAPWPVLGSTTGTRLFWTASLAALPNPLTLLIYAVFGGWASRRWESKGRPRPSVAMRGGVVVLVVLLAAAAWVPQPRAGGREHVFHTPEEARGPYGGFKAAVAGSETQHSHARSTSGEKGIRITPSSRLDIVLRQDSPFLMEVARGAAGKLLEDSNFSSVNIRVVGVEGEGFPRELPVTTILLEWEQEHGSWLPGRRQQKGEIYWKTGNLSTRDHVLTERTSSVEVHAEGWLRFTEEMRGFATRSAVLRDAGLHYGPKIAEAVLLAINQQVHQSIVYGSVPPAWDPPWQPIPEVEEILEGTPELRLVQRGTLPLIEHISSYESDPVPNAAEWLNHWSAMLQQRDWRPMTSTDGEMRAFERRSRIIVLRTEPHGARFRSRPVQDDEPSGRRMHLQALSSLDEEQLAALVVDLLDGDDPPPSLMFMMRASGPPGYRGLLSRRLASTTPRTLAQLNALADMTARDGGPAADEVERAKELIALAEILRLIQPRLGSQTAGTPLDNLRKRAGLEDWHPEPLEEARFRRAGLHPLGIPAEPLEFVLPAGESPSFYYPADGDHWAILSIDIDARGGPSRNWRTTRREALVASGSSAAGTWVTHGAVDLQRTSGGAWETRTMIRKPGGSPGEYGLFIFRVEDMGDEWRWTVSTEERGTAGSARPGPAI